MEHTTDLRQTFPTPRLEHVREVARERRIAAWQATRTAMLEAEAQARARRWIPLGEAADDAVDALGRRIAEQHLMSEPWGRW